MPAAHISQQTVSAAAKERCIKTPACLLHPSLSEEGSCGVGGASRDSAGFGAMEEGLISGGGRNPRLPLCSDSDITVPAELGQESQATSFLRNGTPLASRVVHGVSGPLSNSVWNLQVFPDDARGCQ